MNINVGKLFLKEDSRGKKIPTLFTWLLVGGVVFASYFMSQKPTKSVKIQESQVIQAKDLIDVPQAKIEEQGVEFTIDYSELISEEIAEDKNKLEEKKKEAPAPKRRRLTRSSKMIVFDATKNFKSEKIVPLGSMVKCLLIHNIVTNNFNAPVIAQVWEDFYFNGKELLPFGTRIYGTAFSGRQRDRIAVKFHSIVFPDGKTIKIDAIGLSKDGSGGLTGTIINNTNKKMFVEMAVNFLSGLALGLQDTATNAVTGLTEIENSSRNAMLNGVANTFEKEAKRIQKEIDDAKGYAVVLAGSELVVYFEKQTDVNPL